MLLQDGDFFGIADDSGSIVTVESVLWPPAIAKERGLCMFWGYPSIHPSDPKFDSLVLEKLVRSTVYFSSTSSSDTKAPHFDERYGTKLIQHYGRLAF